MRNSIFLKGVIKLRVLLLFIGTILVTILIIGSMMGFFNNSIPPWMLIIFWAASIVILLGTVMIRQSSPDSCVKCYTMFLPFLLIKIDVFS